MNSRCMPTMSVRAGTTLLPPGSSRRLLKWLTHSLVALLWPSPDAYDGRAKQSLDKPELRVVSLCDYHDKTFAVWTTSPQIPIFLLESKSCLQAKERQIIAWRQAEPEADVAFVDC